MSRLKELEKRLKSEPENLGLRVMLAGTMREAGRSTEAVELYRSVALAYRDQGRPHQAVAVCRSILEIAPEDTGCKALLATLSPTQTPAAPPTRRSSIEETPLPRAVPYHVADPTSAAARFTAPEMARARERGGAGPEIDSDRLPAVEGAKTRPGSEPRPSVTGLADAARRISGLISDVHPVSEIDITDELETRKVRKIETDQLRKIAGAPPSFETNQHEQHEEEELITPVLTERLDALTPVTEVLEDELTQPREMPRGTTKS